MGNLIAILIIVSVFSVVCIILRLADNRQRKRITAEEKQLKVEVKEDVERLVKAIKKRRKDGQ